MKINHLIKVLNATVQNVNESEAEVEGGYCGDFLSFVMQCAPENAVWFTVMTNLNVAAVASLTGVGAVVVCEGSKCDDELVERAKMQKITLLETELDIYNAVKAYLKD